MITERSIINALIVIAVLVIMPFLISSALIEFNYMGLGLLFGLFAMAAGFFVFKDRLALWPLLALNFHGSLPFLPLNLNLSNCFCLLMVAYYITGHVVIRQKQIRLGMPRFLWPMLLVTAIMLYHNHELGIRIAGGTTEGERPVLLAYVTVLAYFAGINLNTLPANFVGRLPWYALLISLFGAIPFIITTFAPSTAPYLAFISTQVNTEAYAETQSTEIGGDMDSGRMPILSAVAMPLQLCLLSYYPIGTWLRPERWWIILLFLLCTYGTVQAGYRSTFFVYTTTIMAATWCYYAWRSLVIPFLVLTAALVLVTASSNHLIAVPLNKLPKMAQRSLSFLPGDWDPEVLETAESSNAFRKNIINVYMAEYAGKSPWIGNGYSIDSEKFDAYGNDLASAGTQQDRDYYQAKLFIEGKMFHTGWVSVYDNVGVIGFMGFVAFGVMLLYTLAEWIFDPKADRRSSLFPCYVWLFSSIAASLIGFFVVFGDFVLTFQYMLIYAIVISHLADLRKITDVPAVRAEVEPSPELARAAGARYGYGYPSRY